MINSNYYNKFEFIVCLYNLDMKQNSFVYHLITDSFNGGILFRGGSQFIAILIKSERIFLFFYLGRDFLGGLSVVEQI